MQPFKIDCQLVNVVDFKNSVNKWSDGARQVARSIVNKHSADISNKAKMNITTGPGGLSVGAPVDRGRLRGDIVVLFFNDGFAANVVAQSSYAAFVEWGTGPKGRATAIKESVPAGYVHHAGNAKMPPLKLIEAWVRRKGIAGKGAKGKAAAKQIAFLIARTIARRGLYARPYMYPALKAVEPLYKADMTRFLELVKRKAG